MFIFFNICLFILFIFFCSWCIFIVYTFVFQALVLGYENKFSFYIPVVSKCSLFTSFSLWFFSFFSFGHRVYETFFWVSQAFYHSLYSCYFSVHTIKKQLGFVTSTVTTLLKLWDWECLNHDFFIILPSLVHWKSENPYFIEVLGGGQNLLEPQWQLRPIGDMVTLRTEKFEKKKTSS